MPRNLSQIKPETVYIVSLSDYRNAPGVRKKLDALLQSTRNVGLKASLLFPPKKTSKLAWLTRVFNKPNSAFILRLDPFSRLSYLIFLATAISRLRCSHITIEVPTPLSIACNEIPHTYGPNAKLTNFLLWTRLHALFPISLLCANRILQYSQETWWFSLGLKKRTHLITNSVSCAAIQCRSNYPELTRRKFSIVAVASVAEWHGYDRVIEGLACYISSQGEDAAEVEFHVVGCGPAIETLRALANCAGLNKQITFHGHAEGNRLHWLIAKSHVAVSAIGIHRKGMAICSDLKSREYAATGIPFISSAVDQDFPPSYPYRLLIPDTDEPVDIALIIQWYMSLDFNRESIEYMRSHAEQKLDFRHSIVNFLP